MQRVLSGQTSRCIETSEEVVTKRLCISFVIVVGFFSMLGGFFLGRYALTYGHLKRSIDDRNQLTEITNRLANVANKINVLTLELNLLSSYKTSVNYTGLNSKIDCASNCKVSMINDSNLKYAVFDIILSDFQNLENCYNNVSKYLESELLSISNIRSSNGGFT